LVSSWLLILGWLLLS